MLRKSNMQKFKYIKHKKYVLIRMFSDLWTISVKPLLIHLKYDLACRIKGAATFTRDSYYLNSDRLLQMRPKGQTSPLKMHRVASRGRRDWNVFDEKQKKKKKRKKKQW